MLDERIEIIERGEVPVMFVPASDEQPAITAAWARLEGAVGSLRGRKFFGLLYDGTYGGSGAEYRACVQMRDDDDPANVDLEVGTIPGGRYARVRLRGEPPSVYGLIAPTFEQLGERFDRDARRPDVEFYRRHDAIDLLLPVP